MYTYQWFISYSTNLTLMITEQQPQVLIKNWSSPGLMAAGDGGGAVLRYEGQSK